MFDCVPARFPLAGSLGLALSMFALAGSPRAQLADLVVSAVSPATTRLVAGQSLTVALSIRNSGLTRAGANRARVSLFRGFQQQDLGFFGVPAISAQRTWSTTFQTRLPSAMQFAGPVRLVVSADVDDVVPELDNFNNARGVDATSIQRSDLALLDLQVNSRRWLRGRTHAASVRIENQGSLPTRSVELALYVSSDPVLTVSDQRLVTMTLPPLGPGSSLSRNVTFTLPTAWPFGACSVGYIVDTRRIELEAREDNNALGVSGLAGVDGTHTAYGASCGPRTKPQYAGTGVPTAGLDARLRLSQAPANTAVALWVGASNQRWMGLRLPIALDGFGAPGCTLAVSPDLAIATRTNALGIATVDVPLPASQIGATFYSQFSILGATNRLGVWMTNGVATRIGN